MPELPEVETVRKSLLKYLKGLVFEKIIIYHDNLIQNVTVDEFKEKLVGKKIHDIKRKGKYLIFCLDGLYLVSHLRMEGKFFIKELTDGVEKHDLAIFNFDSGLSLHYNDTRKFGKMYLTNDLNSLDALEKLGYEPFDNELTSIYLKEKMKRNVAVKTLLLDQTIISGIGNIYADEILFLSKINPNLRGFNLTDDMCELIVENSKIVIEKAIEKGGTTIRSYTSLNGITGKFQNELYVHGKDNDYCKICHNKILKTKINGRGTYYCETCQKGDNDVSI